MNGASESPKVSIKYLLAKKHGGAELSCAEIAAIVEAACSKTMDPSQIGSFLTSVFLRKLSAKETQALTLSMKESGRSLDWPQDIRALTVDKHSTGGVGDKVSLPLTPALAACGYKVPMISGLALGHTGGTLDKLESIPGFTYALTHEQMVSSLQGVGCFIGGQTEDICPADKIFYTCRDATSTVKENGLIASSIVSKKAVENLKALVLDVKVGSGAFMETMDEARLLAQTMVDCSQGLGTDTRALITEMDTPLGNMVGNALEVAESIQCLKGQGPSDLADLVVRLGGHLLEAGHFVSSSDEGCERIKKSLQDGTALEKFRAMLEAQGVSTEHARKLCDPEGDVWSVLARAKHQSEVLSQKSGFVKTIKAMPVGLAAHKLGGGRDKKGEPINHRVGVELLVDVGDPIKEGQAWARVHHDSERLPEDAAAMLDSALVVTESPVQARQTRVREVVKPSNQHEA